MSQNIFIYENKHNNSVCVCYLTQVCRAVLIPCLNGVCWPMPRPWSRDVSSIVSYGRGVVPLPGLLESAIMCEVSSSWKTSAISSTIWNLVKTSLPHQWKIPLTPESWNKRCSCKYVWWSLYRQGLAYVKLGTSGHWHLTHTTKRPKIKESKQTMYTIRIELHFKKHTFFERTISCLNLYPLTCPLPSWCTI